MVYDVHYGDFLGFGIKKVPFCTSYTITQRSQLTGRKHDRRQV
jgi:hypothetical protein